MKKKMTYVAPETEQLSLKMETSFLTSMTGNAPEQLNEVDGSWD